MTSLKQLEANRENAKRSTGPRTEEGKARSRLNSWKHGLAAETLVIGDEDPVQFDQLRAELMEQYDPQLALEGELVERLAGLLWRLRRLPAFEAAIIDARRAQVAYNDSVRNQAGLEELSGGGRWARSLGRALTYDGISGDAIGKLARHETTLMNALRRTLQVLLLLQANRANKDDEGPLIEGADIPSQEQ